MVNSRHSPVFLAVLMASMSPLLTAIAPAVAQPIPSRGIAQELLPPPPTAPNPVPDPSQFEFTANTAVYRVLALITSNVQEQQVKVAYPGAFYTDYQGQRMLQVGSFRDPLNAQQAALSLQNLGLATAIAP